ncbi:MAG: hypothetical protein QM621_00290 [Aeromicrobium sp.]|uniref:hypothetical protein n=1 Tax=Aeromicrobium sp. TaxID=1871063 RepID=UPI0039E39203
MKSSASVDPRSARGLGELRDAVGDRFTAGVVFFTGRQTLLLSDHVWAVPSAGLWEGA